MIRFLVLRFCPRRRAAGHELTLTAQNLLNSCSADASTVTNWVFWFQKSSDPDYMNLKTLLLISCILGTFIYLVLCADLRPFSYLAQEANVRISTGIVLFFGILVDDIPQVVLSVLLDSLEGGELSIDGEIGAVAVCNMITAVYDALIKFAEAFDAREDVHATGFADQLIKRIERNDNTLETVDFTGRLRRADDFQAMTEAIQHNTAVKELILCDNGLDDKACFKIAVPLKVNTALVRLDLSENSICKRGVEKITAALKLNADSSLAALFLQSNDIGDEGAEKLSQFLANSVSLTEIDLSGNKIKHGGARKLGSSLATNKTLTSLLMSNNQIRNDGCTSLVNDVSANSKTVLARLVLDNNRIGPRGAQAISRLLVKNKTLTSLSLSENAIGDEGANFIANVLAGKGANKAMKELFLDVAGIGNAGAAGFSAALRENRTLTLLSLSGNAISSDALSTLRKRAQGSTALNALILENQITEEGEEDSLPQRKSTDASHGAGVEMSTALLGAPKRDGRKSRPA